MTISHIRTSWLCALVLIAGATAAVAQSGPPVVEPALLPSEPHREHKQGKFLRAMRTQTPPTLDGRLNDEVWGLADVAGDYMQRDPDNGKPMTQGNRVQIAYDDRFLYVAITSQ